MNLNNKVKSLVIFYPSFEKGGVEKNLINLVRNLDKKFRIYLISSLSKREANKILKKKINIIQISKKKISFIPNRFSSAFFGMISLFNLLKIIKKDFVVHSMQSNIAAMIVCFFLRKKILMRNSEDPLYSTYFSENKIMSIIVFIFKIITYNFVSGIITNSKGSKKSLEKFIFNKDKIFSIYNPYLINKNSKRYKREKIIINIARLRKQKDHITLIKAFNIFSKKYKDYKLVILGHGDQKKILYKEARNLSLQTKIKFLGWVNNTPDYLKKSKLFVLSSIYEGLGNVLIDAINYDVPCISTDCHSGPREILLNGKGGYLVPIKDYKSLGYKMIYAITNYNESKHRNKIAKKNLIRFDMKKQVSAYEKILIKFIN